MAIAYPALGPAAVQFRLLSDWECKSARCANLILYTLKCQEMRVRTLRVLEAKVMVMVNMMSRCLDLIARLLCMCMHYINTEQLVLCNIRRKLSLACILCVGACACVLSSNYFMGISSSALQKEPTGVTEIGGHMHAFLPPNQ